MFYSHQLLARKAPLGQIWMAATLHAKMNRKKLNMINIISICEEILNPAAPMALRLSGILMGGVVIVYERKVKLLYEDVTRLLVEINEAWKVKPATDRTLLPKRKLQAKKEAVTLPEVQDEELPDIEQSMNFSSSNATTLPFQQTSYFAVQLDTLDETYINNDTVEDDVTGNKHQADPDNIKLFERFDSCQVNTDMYDRFERFDIDGEGDTQMIVTSGDLPTDIHTTVIPSPPRQDEDLGGIPFTDKEIPDQQPESLVNQPSEEHNEGRQMLANRRKRRRQAANWMDMEKTVIPCELYQTWLQNASDITSRNDKKRKEVNKSIMSRMKVASLMELPPMVLVDDLSINANKDIYYPAPLLVLWTKSTQPPHDSPSARATSHQPPEASNSSPQDAAAQFEDLYNFDDYQSGAGSQSIGIPFEKQVAPVVGSRNVLIGNLEAELFGDEFEANLDNNNIRMGRNKEPAVVTTTPGNPGKEARSVSSSGSGHSVLRRRSEINSGHQRSGSSLRSIPEDTSWLPDPDIPTVHQKDPALDQEVLLETGPTQTQQPFATSQPVDALTEAIRMHLKTHFEGPEAPEYESLNNLATGMNRKPAALLFYQTCVLATRGCIAVDQKVPYGDILISNRSKI
ncbi:unnamed protein product [Linum tenue]|uniref:Sister chromatid cohesion 1 protein 1 n=1 Tax=Linum tenue TaxID=586396 RepID=A0AAV0K1N0_9ROSI|nr:unnamed protein product [Linum tenue]